MSGFSCTAETESDGFVMGACVEVAFFQGGDLIALCSFRSKQRGDTNLTVVHYLSHCPVGV